MYFRSGIRWMVLPAFDVYGPFCRQYQLTFSPVRFQQNYQWTADPLTGWYTREDTATSAIEKVPAVISAVATNKLVIAFHQLKKRTFYRVYRSIAALRKIRSLLQRYHNRQLTKQSGFDSDTAIHLNGYLCSELSAWLLPEKGFKKENANYDPNAPVIPRILQAFFVNVRSELSPSEKPGTGELCLLKRTGQISVVSVTQCFCFFDQTARCFRKQ